jgi:hypothetical protein
MSGTEWPRNILRDEDGSQSIVPFIAVRSMTRFDPKPPRCLMAN